MNAKISDIEMALGNLKGEVKDFHPHLREFLSKLDDVTHVEYTHGSSEYGADFVLSQQEGLTGKTIYVGVIVKNTGINQRSVDEVIRQISECEKIKREIGGGIHRVRMNRVWVIANGTISKNAKEKIHESHHIGVTFTDRKDLAGLMAKNDYDFSGDLPANVSICLSKQLGFAENLKSQSIGLGISNTGSMFMHQKVAKVESVQYAPRGQRMREKKLRPLKEVSIKSAINRHSSFVLRGEAGCGKSKMLQNVLSDYASEKEYKKTKMIPIFTTCSDMLDKYDRSISILIARFEKEHSLENIDPEPCYMIIIDGIDECGLHRDARFDIIKEWKNESSSLENVRKVIFSTRDYVEDTTFNIPVYKVFDLSIREIIDVIKRNLSYLDTVDRIVEDVVRSDIFRSLPRNPLATVILINILGDENARHELPSNLTDLFAKYAECSLGRWDTHKKEGVKQKEYEAADKILTQIAIHMLDSRADQINENEARNFFRSYLKDRNLGINYGELFEKTAAHSNLLDVHDGVFRFKHRTIAEFFYSKNFSDDRINAIGENIFDARWATILFFYVGIRKDCPSLLREINSIEPQHESGKILKAINMANILLAGYATPYCHIQEILKSIFIDTSQYLDDVFSRRVIDSSLSKHSTMRVLLFFRIMMDYEYSRPFFKQAIEDSLIEIEELDIQDNVKATSLFLLNLANASLGGEDIFIDMVKNLGNRIPAHIKLAINHETDIMKNVGKDIKKFKRTVKRQLLSARKSDQIKYLYNEQIRYLPSLMK